MGAVVVDGIADPDPVLAKAAEYATVPPTLRATLLADRLRDWPGAGGVPSGEGEAATTRSEEHTSELQSLMRISYAVFCLKKKNNQTKLQNQQHTNELYDTTVRKHRCTTT